MHRSLLLAGIGIFLSLSPTYGLDIFSGFGVRIKDIAMIEGARPNQLRGMGLVTGLNRTGDRSDSSLAAEMLRGVIRGEQLIPDGELTGLAQNNAAVMVYAEIPPFAKPGTKIDVQIAAIGGANSLTGGVLLQTPLKGADGNVYAVAQGPLATGTFEFGGKASKVVKGGTSGTVAQIPHGAIVEEEIPVSMVRNQYIYLSLKNPDFTTAVRMADAINTMKLFKEHLIDEPASPIDAATVRIELPERLRDEVKNSSRPEKRNGQPQLIRIIQKIENMIVEPDQTARIVVNERTGTIVVGEHVRISTVAISHGALSVSITENAQVSQPGAFAEGETETVDRTSVDVEEGGGQTNLLQGGITVAELAKALNSLGTTSRDIIAILQAIKRAGALQADLIIM